MNKVICDVCGTDYPETAAQCPICGCAKAGGEQTSAGNNAGEAATGYTYVKGGRFSKANVKKRLKESQAQQAVQKQSAGRRNDDDYDEEDEFDEDEEESVSNKGLILIVILLLLAIIAVSSYIAITFYGGKDDLTPSQPQSTQNHGTTAPTSPSTGSNEGRVACTGLELYDRDIRLADPNKPWELYFEVQPANTTDILTFTSSDPSVAMVDANGFVYAVGNGEATITVQCGDLKAECPVICELDEIPGDPTDPEPTQTDPTDPEPTQTDPTDPEPTQTAPTDPEPTQTDPTEPKQELVLNRVDFTLSSKGESWQLYDGDIDRSKIKWSSDDETIVTVEDGLVVAVGKGRTVVRAEYDGQVVTCWVSVNIQEEPTEPEPTEPEPTEPEPTEPEPTEPEEILELNRDDFSLFAEGESWQLYNGDIDRSQIVWSSDDESVATVEDGLVVAVGNGRTTIRAVYNGQEVTCWVSVQIAE